MDGQEYFQDGAQPVKITGKLLRKKLNSLELGELDFLRVASGCDVIPIDGTS
ncbi:hypothetical protein SO802_033898 [Lithocarpus litseifolius]|uniref:Uncharacterized protein n=1 Tax=Lithocarpus litseifolius TaxID=425828 RepID=A0AAW2BG33_9ROSI